MILAKYIPWNISDHGNTLEEISEKIGCPLDKDLVIVKEFTETEWILRDVPEEFKSRLSYMAYERGHSAGESEIIGILQGLVSDLLPCIKAFAERIS